MIQTLARRVVAGAICGCIVVGLAAGTADARQTVSGLLSSVTGNAAASCRIEVVTPIAVRVKIKDAAGAPIVGMRLGIYTNPERDNRKDSIEPATGTDGTCSFEINPRAGLKGFAIRPLKSQPAGINCTALGIPREWVVSIPSNPSEIIQAEFTCPGSATASFRLLEGTVPVPEYSLFEETYDFVSYWRVSDDGVKASIPGLPLGQASEICVSVLRTNVMVAANRHSVYQIILVTTPVLTANTDLGDVQAPPFVADSTLDITFTGTPLPINEPPFARAGEGVMLISPDGNTLYSCGVHLVAGDPDLSTPHRVIGIPHGTYYLVPGGKYNVPNYRRVMSRIRAGENLANSGIPQVTLTPGATSTVTLNEHDAEVAIYAEPQ